MSTAEIEAEVQRRVDEELAKRANAEQTPAAAKELQDKQNAGLRALVASATQEPANAYGTGRDFSRGRDLAKREGVQTAAAGLALEVEEELRGTQWELDNG